MLLHHCHSTFAERHEFEEAADLLAVGVLSAEKRIADALLNRDNDPLFGLDIMNSGLVLDSRLLRDRMVSSS